MPAALFLTRKYNDYQRRRVGVAMQLAEDLARADPVVPVDTGQLESGIRVINRFIAAPRYRAIITSRALSADGANYARILEVAPRIAPRRRKFLRFEVAGEVVFSKGFDNVHFRWWTRLIGQRPSVWRRALVEAGQAVRY